VEANGGRVHAESLPGQGTSMVVEFPIERQAAAPVREGAT
jgi:signal transduction histidine kinase